jgi:hypothetical protein
MDFSSALSLSLSLSHHGLISVGGSDKDDAMEAARGLLFPHQDDAMEGLSHPSPLSLYSVLIFQLLASSVLLG